MGGQEFKEPLFVHENQLPKDGEIREQEVWNKNQEAYKAEVSAAREMISKKREQLIREMDEQLDKELQSLLTIARNKLEHRI